MTRTALYLRISDPKGDKADKYGLAAQERACRDYAERAGLEVQRVYTDTITGIAETRAGFGQLLAEAEAYSDVIVYAVDRLARHPKAGYALLETLQASGLIVHTAIEGMLDLTDDAGAMNFGMRVVFADAERRKIIRRLNDGKRQKVRGKPDRGTPGAPVVPLHGFGYRQGAIYEPEAQWVRWMFQQALQVGAQEIAEALTRLGVPGPGGRPWFRTTVLRLLKTPVYRGEYSYGRKNPVTCAVPAIVTPELWYAVARAIAQRATGAGKRGSRTDVFPLTGRIHCAECGVAMVGMVNHSSGAATRYHYYRCGDRYRAAHRRTGCAHRTSYRADHLNRAVREALRGLLHDQAATEAAITAPAPLRLDPGPAVEELERQLARAKSAYLRGIDSEAEYAETKAKLQAKKAKLLELASQPQAQAVASPGAARAALREALKLPDLHAAAVRLGLRVTVAPGGALRLTLDPA